MKETVVELLNTGAKEAAGKMRALGFSEPEAALRNLKILSEGPFAPLLDDIASDAARSPSPNGALNNLESITTGVGPALIADSLKDGGGALGELITICGSSSYLSGILARHPALYEWIFSEEGLTETKGFADFHAELGVATGGEQEADDMARALREYKHKEYLRIGAKDLLRKAGMVTTTRELSDLAAASLDTALAWAIGHLKSLHGAPLYIDDEGAEKEAGLSVIGMGKLGGGELNFSSDIDIIYVYSSDHGETAGVDGKASSKISLHAFFVKAAQIINRLISSVTENGIVFRVDVDLRPEGRSGALANSLASMEAYYESWGLSWERAAMIKARPVAGDLALGEAFMSMIRPFVFRRYMDFTILEEIKLMKEKVDLSLIQRNPDAVDVKLGAGGIREIEFFCQALQLVHAGKDETVRGKNTLETLENLSQAGYVKKDEAAALKESYIFLRDLEHRIQIVECRQSQAVPARPEELERLARMMGFTDSGEKKAGRFFWEEYKKRTGAVHEIYRSLFYKEEPEEELPEEVRILLSTEMGGEDAIEKLAALGFKKPEEAAAHLHKLRGGPSFVQMGARTRVIFKKLAPVFLSRVIESPDPDRALSYLERFISSVGARASFYSLLFENRKVLDELIRLFGTSEFLSRTLVEQPGSLEQLLSRDMAAPYRTRSAILTEFAGALASETDYEQRLEVLRRLKNSEIFRIGVNDIAGAVGQRRVSTQITFVAEASLEAAVRIARDELEKKHGKPEGKFCVLGLGKLGGSEMIYGSDLDILFVYSTTDEDANTTGERPISDHEFFVKLGQRIISVLTLRTQGGFVFNVDARLRPSGRALVVSMPSLFEYHRSKTAIWERQALTKARFVAGDAAFGVQAAAELSQTAYSPAKTLTAEDVEEMYRIRVRMEEEIAKETERRYNIKAGAGGVNDIEFLVQALQLRWGAERPSLRTPQTAKALLRLFREQLLAQDDYEFLKEAYRFLRLLELRQRIVNDRPEGDLVQGSPELTTLAKRLGYSGPDGAEKLLEDYKRYAGKIRKIYIKILDGLKKS